MFRESRISLLSKIRSMSASTVVLTALLSVNSLALFPASAIAIYESEESDIENRGENRPSEALICNNYNSPIPEKKQVILYIDTFGDKAEWPFLLFKWKMKRAFPERPIRSVLAESLSDLGSQLDVVLQDDEAISHLYVGGHGYSDGEADRFVWHVGDDEMWVQYTPWDKDKKVSDKYFQGIQGRFTKTSKTIFTNCDLLNGEALSAERKASALCRLLKIPSGDIYANSTKGSDLGLIFRRSAQIVPPHLAALRRFEPVADGLMATYLLHGIIKKPRSAPIFLLRATVVASAGYIPHIYKHYYTYNRGYICEVKDHTIQQMRPSNYFDEKRTFMNSEHECSVEMSP